jgi:hypothetical protein
MRDGTVRTVRQTWFDHSVIALALVLLLSGFGTIVEGRDWWVTTMLVAVMTGLTCAVLRGLGARLVAPVAIAVELAAIVWIFVPDTLLAIVPTTQTVTALADLVSVAQQTIVEEKAPVAASRPIVLVVASAFGLIVVVADLLLQRRRAAPLVGMLLLAVFATRRSSRARRRRRGCSCRWQACGWCSCDHAPRPRRAGGCRAVLPSRPSLSASRRSPAHSPSRPLRRTSARSLRRGASRRPRSSGAASIP